MTTYKIVRSFFDEEVGSKVVARRLSLEEAQEHCRNPETSSKTCKKPENVARTKKYGAWFDGYEEE